MSGSLQRAAKPKPDTKLWLPRSLQVYPNVGPGYRVGGWVGQKPVPISVERFRPNLTSCTLTHSLPSSKHVSVSSWWHPPEAQLLLPFPHTSFDQTSSTEIGSFRGNALQAGGAVPAPCRLVSDSLQPMRSNPTYFFPMRSRELGN